MARQAEECRYGKSGGEDFFHARIGVIAGLIFYCERLCKPAFAGGFSDVDTVFAAQVRFPCANIPPISPISQFAGMMFRHENEHHGRSFSEPSCRCNTLATVSPAHAGAPACLDCLTLTGDTEAGLALGTDQP